MTSLSPVPVEPLIGRPGDLCPDASFFMCIYMSDFVQIGLRESGQKRRTDGRPDGRLKKDEMVYAIPGKLSERIMLHENLAKYEVS